MALQKIMPTSVFPNSRIKKHTHIGRGRSRSTMLTELLCHPDPSKAQRAMNSMLTMKKLDIHELQEAISG